MVRSTASLAAPSAGAARTLTSSSPLDATPTTSSRPARGVTRTVNADAQRNRTSRIRMPRPSISTSGDRSTMPVWGRKRRMGASSGSVVSNRNRAHRAVQGGIDPREQHPADDHQPQHGDQKLEEDAQEATHGRV